MFRVTSLTEMPEARLNRLIKLVALALLIGVVAFIAFYAIDRFRATPPAIVDQQLAALEEKVRADPADGVARGQLADLYFAKSRFDEAVVQYTALIDAKRDVELASLGRGNAYRELARYDEAKQDYNVVISIATAGEMANIDPTLEAAYYGLGKVALLEGRPNEAIEPLSRALAIIRTDADALNAIAQAYIATDQADKAIEPLTTTIALVPVGWAEPYSNLAAAYGKLGKADHAAWANAMALMQSGDAASAEQELTRLVDSEAALEATVSLGIARELAGDTAAAATWYEQALELDSTNITAQMGLTRVRTGTTQPSAAPSAGVEGSN
jgi:tetratricopeptide (TPR) repeat protein